MDDAAEFTVDLLAGEDEVIVKVQGDLDVATVGRFANALADTCQQPGTQVVVDLSDVGFISVRAVSVLAVTGRRFRGSGGRLAVAGLSGWQERLVRLCALDKRAPSA
jgi:anti-anti-sigma factor